MKIYERSLQNSRHKQALLYPLDHDISAFEAAFTIAYQQLLQDVPRNKAIGLEFPRGGLWGGNLLRKHLGHSQVVHTVSKQFQQKMRDQVKSKGMHLSSHKEIPELFPGGLRGRVIKVDDALDSGSTLVGLLGQLYNTKKKSLEHDRQGSMAVHLVYSVVREAGLRQVQQLTQQLQGVLDVHLHAGEIVDDAYQMPDHGELVMQLLSARSKQ